MPEHQNRQPRCFIAMPITTHPEDLDRFNGDSAHWIHVMETIFVPAIERAGYEAIRPVTQGSHMIHGEIIKQLATADMVLCDLSGHNPNVFFELGVRTSLNKPVALVRDEHTTLPFDTSGLNTHDYDSSLKGWETAEQVEKLKDHLAASAISCGGSNPLWRHFGLTITAAQPEPNASVTDARLELIQEELHTLRRSVEFVAPARLHDADVGEDRLANAARALGKLLQAKKWTVSHGPRIGPSQSVEIEFWDFKKRPSAGELDSEARKFGCEVMSGAVRENRYQILLRELDFDRR